MKYPYWIVDGVRFKKVDIAREYAKRISRESGQSIPILQVSGSLYPAFVLEKVKV